MQLFFREKGITSNPPLILLHGLWGASDNWLPVASLLSRHFHVILPDLRNHGHSSHSSSFNYELAGEDIVELITRLNLQQKPFLAGHSMGGKILMRLLLNRPEIVQKAAIIDIGPQIYTPDSSSIHLRLLHYMLTNPLQNYRNRQDIHQDIRRYFTVEEEAQILLKNLCKENNGFTWKVNVEAIQNHLTDILGWAIPKHIPPYPNEILFIKAEQSEYLTAEISEEIKYYFPAARQIVIPASTHFIHVDQPERLAHTLSTFFLSH